MTDFTAAGSAVWIADFTGNALVQCWGGGAGGGGGVGLTRGGPGGGGGALASAIIPVVSGHSYSLFVGDSGTMGGYGGGAGGDGQASTFQSTAVIAAGGKGGVGQVGGKGGAIADCTGTTKVQGGNGAAPSGYNGGQGGAGAGDSGGPGGLGGVPGNSHGQPGGQPGAGGGGGYQSTGAVGGLGGRGMVRITQASTVIPGFHLDEETMPGSYAWVAPADGHVVVECYGGGGGARGGVSLGNGAAGGGGGGYSETTIPVWAGVTYTRVVGAGGTGAPWNTNTATDGADSSFSVPVATINNKALTSNVATLTTVDPHPFSVGDSVVVAGVDATFNGTFTVTARTAKTFSYAKSHANVGSTSATGTGTSSAPTKVLAKAGLRSTGTTTGAGAGGQASAGIGTTKNSGGNGLTGTSTTQIGGQGGSGALPNGGVGGQGGTTAAKAGGAGTAPGGGGGGGHANTGGSGGNGAPGAVRIGYFLTYGTVAIGGLPRAIVAISRIESHVRQPLTPYIVRSLQKLPTALVKPDLTIADRTPPTYIPAGHTAAFDIHRGTFNWSTPHLDAALAGGADPQIVIVGDSVSEGWTYLNNNIPFNHTADFLHAWPLMMRNKIAEILGIPVSGTGLVRPTTANTPIDPRWTGNWTGEGHWIYSPDTTKVAHFNSDLPGTAVAVDTIGGAVNVIIDGTNMGNTVATASGTAKRTVFTGLSNVPHVVTLQATTAPAGVLAVECYNPGVGLRVHNLAQGGAKAAGTGQPSWADTTAAPDNMLPDYDQIANVFDRAPDAVIIMLGGNDLHSGFSYTDITAAHQTIAAALDGASTDIIMMPDPHGSNLFLPDSYNTYVPMWAGIMQLCLDHSYSYIDGDWLTGGYPGLKGQGFVDDEFGHLNTAGAKFFGEAIARVVLDV